MGELDGWSTPFIRSPWSKTAVDEKSCDLDTFIPSIK